MTAQGTLVMPGMPPEAQEMLHAASKCPRGDLMEYGAALAELRSLAKQK